jgi:Uma2 family endonuclease
MADGAPRRMSADEFLDWCTHKEDARYELVDGQTVMMVGATDRHDQIVVNLIAELRTRLRGTPCAPRTADQAVKTRGDARVRRPDVLVDCGPRNPNGLYAPNPTVVFEVLSPYTENVTLSSKLDEYKSIASIAHIVLLAQDKVFVRHHARVGNDAWTEEALSGVDAVLKLAAIKIELSLREIYADVSFDGD